MRIGERSRNRHVVWASVLALALLFHLLALVVLQLTQPWWKSSNTRDFAVASMMILEPAPVSADEEEEEEPPETPDGQLVEMAPPEEQEIPDESEYLAEFNEVVEEETRTEKFEINPEVIAREHSREQKLEMEDLVDLDVDKPSTGARVGNDRFDPDRDGTMAALPSPWTFTNRDGTQDPVPAAHMSQQVTGAPQNDLLNEKPADQVNLNLREYQFAGYLNRIRRLVNFYWEQNLDNLPRSVRLAKPRYTTDVSAILDADGALEYVAITSESGSGELDDAVVRAFRLAGPFPNPPDGLIAKDGRVYLPDMSFTVVLGVAQNRYQGIDPRAGVQFPGILKSPR